MAVGMWVGKREKERERERERESAKERDTSVVQIN